MTVYLCANVVALFVADADDFRRVSRDDKIIELGACGNSSSYGERSCETALGCHVSDDETNRRAVSKETSESRVAADDIDRWF
jgi:hypothetical protein